jgi:cell division protein ZapA
MAPSDYRTKSTVGASTPERGNPLDATTPQRNGIDANTNQIAPKARATISRQALTGALAAATAVRAKALPVPASTNTAQTAHPRNNPKQDVESMPKEQRSDTRPAAPGLPKSTSAAPNALASLGNLHASQRQVASLQQPTPKPTKPSTQTLTIGGNSYRVLSSASPTELTRLAAIVDAKLKTVAGKAGAHALSSPQTILLAAIALAHDAELANAERTQLERRTRDMIRRTLLGLEDVIDRNSAENLNDAAANPLQASEPLLVPEQFDATTEQAARSAARATESEILVPHLTHQVEEDAHSTSIEARDLLRLKD